MGSAVVAPEPLHLSLTHRFSGPRAHSNGQTDSNALVGFWLLVGKVKGFQQGEESAGLCGGAFENALLDRTSYTCHALVPNIV